MYQMTCLSQVIKIFLYNCVNNTPFRNTKICVKCEITVRRQHLLLQAHSTVLVAEAYINVNLYTATYMKPLPFHSPLITFFEIERISSINNLKHVT